MDIARLSGNYDTLGGAIIGQAVKDLRSKNMRNKRDALCFLRGKRLDKFIDIFNLPLSASYIRKKLRKGGAI